MTSSESGSTVAVYTAIYDDYDTLIDPGVVENGVDYICFTDDPDIESEVWDTRVQRPMENPALANRRVKILAHEYLNEYDMSVYIDGNIQIRDELLPLINDYLSDSSFAVYKHPERNSLYDEADACIALNKAEKENVIEQMEHYRQQGFADELDLAANRVLFRRHNDPEIKDLMWSWWREVSEHASRDQLSLMFVLWQHDIGHKLIPHPIRSAPQFSIHPHRPDGYLGWIWPYWISIRSGRDSSPMKNVLFYSGKALHVLKNEGVSSLITKSFSKVRQPISETFNRIGDQLGIIGPDQIYSEEYYAKRQNDPFRSESHEIVDTLIKQFQPDSVIDFGCAIGTYLERFEQRNVRIHGVEGNSAAFNHAVVSTEFLEQHDLRQPYNPTEYYDLVLSVEVAEHIPERYSKTFVQTLAKSGDTIVMTAAPPGQGGTHHVNEKTPDFWIELFKQQGMEYDRETTELLEEKISVNSLYHVPKNMMVFVTTNSK